uniref:Uncharacterized protein n=1 Tax=Rhizophora mucronata TaxID=61149 RepID=A0A2P2QYP6_RHIMU
MSWKPESFGNKVAIHSK